jgi:hypothetical protein
LAPLVRIIFEKVLVDNAPLMSITNTALLSPSALRYSESVREVAASSQ